MREPLAAASVAGVDEIYKMGGAQAIAALAFGTESVPKVDKITGPGNIFVALAKKACFGYVGIDSIAGPSEILVIADETANPRYVAADLLSQAEHDVLASAILITTSRKLAEQVSEQIDGFLSTLKRREIIQKSLDNYGYILIASDLDAAAQAADEIASRTSGDPHAGSLCHDDKDPQRGSHFPGRIFQRAAGRLLRGAEPCASDERDRPVLLPSECGRFHEKDQPDFLFQTGAGSRA